MAKKSININATLKILGVVFLCLFLITKNLQAQQKGTKQAEIGVSDSLLNSHSPKRASILSAIIPGAGQVYNKKYWKLPLIYGSIGAGIYFLDKNLKSYYALRYNYKIELAKNENFSNAQDLAAIETTRKSAEISVIAIAVVYVLNIVDASVDAHLFHFDVSNDLSFNFQPVIFPTRASNNTFVGGKFCLKF